MIPGMPSWLGGGGGGAGGGGGMGDWLSMFMNMSPAASAYGGWYS
jgi:hypothetical protein